MIAAPPPQFSTQLMPGNETFTSDAMTLAVEGTATDVRIVPGESGAPTLSATRPEASRPGSQPYPQRFDQQPPARDVPPATAPMGGRGFAVPQVIAGPEMQQTAALSQSDSQPHSPSHPPAQRPMPPDPLVASVSAMNIEIGAPDPRARALEGALARTPSLQDSANISPPSQRVAVADPAPLPSFGPRSSTRRLGIAVAVLAVALLGIVGALVATIQSGPSATEAHAEPSAQAVATAAAAPGPASATPVVAPAPEPAPAPPPEPEVAKPTPSASASAAAKAEPPKSDDVAKKDEPKKKDTPKIAPRGAPGPKGATGDGDGKKAPKHVQDLGSGL